MHENVVTASQSTTFIFPLPCRGVCLFFVHFTDSRHKICRVISFGRPLLATPVDMPVVHAFLSCPNPSCEKVILNECRRLINATICRMQPQLTGYTRRHNLSSSSKCTSAWVKQSRCSSWHGRSFARDISSLSSASCQGSYRHTEGTEWQNIALFRSAD